MGLLGKKSFFAKEKERIDALIEEQLLLQVLQYLPHHQLTEEDQDATWEVIAINLNNYLFVKSLKTNNDTPAIKNGFDLPTLNAFSVKESYNKLQSEHNRRYCYNEMNPPSMEDVQLTLQKPKEYILHELYVMRSIGAKVLSKLARERFEEKQKARFDKMMDSKQFVLQSYNPEESEEIASQLDVETKSVLDNYKDSQVNLKLEIYERELIKKHQRIELLLNENKRLLDLNHELLEEMKR